MGMGGITRPSPNEHVLLLYDFWVESSGRQNRSVETHPDSALAHTLTKAKTGCQNLYAPRINWKISLLKAKASRETDLSQL